ncbi:MAG: metal ABC transporter solute-binding protein, Zn/Mn family [Pseudolabrys sp.]
MKPTACTLIVGVLAALAPAVPAAVAETVAVVAAQSFYGDIAKQIGGAYIAAADVPMTPGQDPHLFEPSPAIARQIADARIVIINGAHYDPWAEKLLKSSPKPTRIVIDAARLTGTKHGDNPHIWYDPKTMPAVARAFADALGKADPAHAAEYNANLTTTLAKLAAIDKRVAELKAKHGGKPVAATEPVAGPMTNALELVMRNERFQLAVMNETEPTARDIAAFERDLKNRNVKALIYNKQVNAKLAQHMVALAEKSKIPVVAVTETMPADTSYVDWMLATLDALDKALNGSNQ